MLWGATGPIAPRLRSGIGCVRTTCCCVVSTSLPRVRTLEGRAYYSKKLLDQMLPSVLLLFPALISMQDVGGATARVLKKLSPKASLTSTPSFSFCPRKSD